MKCCCITKNPIAIVSILLFSWSFNFTRAMANEIYVAVTANFTATAKEIAADFASVSGHKIRLSSGSTGKLYTQILNGAPFQIFLAADTARAAEIEAKGFGVPRTRFTYALGRIVLYSTDPSLVDGEGKVLNIPDAFVKLAIANPKTAPYGAAAIEVMEKLRVYDQVKSKIVQGDNVAQAHQFVVTGNAQLGFVALSQVVEENKGSRWIVPASFHAPIRQDAILLKTGADNVVAREFIQFLKGDRAKLIIRKYGYIE